jgi:sulfotransferase
MFFISGLPRTGSTLLSSLLSQNPKIYSEGHSSLCQIMWDTKLSCFGSSLPDIKASGRNSLIDEILCSLPKKYYFDIDKDYIFDKCSYWTFSENYKMITNYIEKNPKIIVLVRDIKEILNSFLYVYQKNNKYYDGLEEYFLYQNSIIINAAIDGVVWAKNNNQNNNFLFLNYDSLCENPSYFMKKIYDFLSISYFDTNFTNIKNIYPENDSVYELNGLHSVRPNISKIKRKNLINPKYLIDCEKINEKIKDLL